MRHRGRLLDVLDRAETGPLIDEKEFERKLVAQTGKRLIAEHGLKYDPKTVIPADDAQADRLFEAGLEFAVTVGMLCTSTLRRITWTRAEYEEALRYAPHEAILGEGADAVLVQARTPEDAARPMVIGGAFGVEVPENLFVPLMLSYAKESLISGAAVGLLAGLAGPLAEHPANLLVAGAPVSGPGDEGGVVRERSL
jgi:methylamine--corrinoid protein Co-methyltransferase